MIIINVPDFKSIAKMIKNILSGFNQAQFLEGFWFIQSIHNLQSIEPKWSNIQEVNVIHINHFLGAFAKFNRVTYDHRSVIHW
jgi:hypothetical protein